MKRITTNPSILLCVCVLIMLSVSAKVSAQFYDAFTDSNYTMNPTWTGDTSHFKVNTSFELQTKDTLAGKSYLSTPTPLSTLDNMQWSFYIHLGFSPSANNNARVYLTSDSPNLENGLHGYYLQFGEALSMDAVELFRQDDTVLTSVCRGINAEIATSFYLGVKVTRDPSGLWQLLVDTAGGTNYQLEASATDITYNSSSWFGVVCTYTVSNAVSFYYDDFNVSYSICNFTASSSQTNVLCNGDANGTAVITSSGGLSPYTYLWLPDGQSTDTITGLAAGNYYGIITDINQCSDTIAVTILEPTQLNAAVSSTGVTCNGNNNGTATVTVQGGTPPYSYSWSPAGGTGNVATNLGAGTYTVTVTDANGCITTATTTITEPLAIIVTTNTNDASCSLCCDGMASVNATGGTPALTYLWSNGEITQTIDSLCTGTYAVTVTDANGCSITDSVIVTFNVGENELLSENNFHISPNPVSSKLAIRLVESFLWRINNSKLAINAIEIYNVIGEMVMIVSPLSLVEGLECEADVSQLPPALYFLKVKSDNGISIQRFVKE